MLKTEFEQIANYEVSDKDYYEIIEPMYMATNLDKVSFVACLDKKRFALKTKKQLINIIKKEAKHLQATFTHYTDWDSKDRMHQALQEIKERFPDCRYADIYYYPEASCFYPGKLWLNEYEQITL